MISFKSMSNEISKNGNEIALLSDDKTESKGKSIATLNVSRSAPRTINENTNRRFRLSDLVRRFNNILEVEYSSFFSADFKDPALLRKLVAATGFEPVTFRL